MSAFGREQSFASVCFRPKAVIGSGVPLVRAGPIKTNPHSLTQALLIC